MYNWNPTTHINIFQFAVFSCNIVFSTGVYSSMLRVCFGDGINVFSLMGVECLHIEKRNTEGLDVHIRLL